MHPGLSPTSPVVPELAAELWRSAAGVLDANGAGSPGRSHQRSWDTAFAAIGLAYVNPGRAWRDLRSLFEAQWPDGRVPHVVPGADDHLPGLVHPPLHALAAWEVYRHASAHGAAAVQQARTELAWLYPRLVAAQDYLIDRRDVGGAGLAAIVHPEESALGDSPAWDEALRNSPAPGEALRDSPVLGEALRNSPAPGEALAGPGPAHHAELAASYRDSGCADTGLLSRHAFVVECPGFNAVLATAELALAQIAGVLGQGAQARQHRETGRRITAAIADRLWDPRTLAFHARDLRTGRLSPARCITGLLPLLLPDLPPFQALAIMAEAGSGRFGLPAPSHDRTAPDFDERKPWRGPVSLPVNWLLRRGMLVHGYRADAENLRRAVLRLAHRSGHHEHFHPVDGSGLGAVDFTGTAALCLDLLADRSAPAYAHLSGARLAAV